LTAADYKADTETVIGLEVHAQLRTQSKLFSDAPDRCGVPLVEIVSEPDLRGPEEVSAYLRALQEILRYAGASDADMEKGQFRCDVNLSLRPRGSQELGTRTEIKNLNSFRFAEAAARAEVERQRALLARGEAVQQATLGYDAERGLLFTMRVKENADDYRYFPDPDLPPLQISAERIEKERQSLPELPAARRHRFTAGFGLAPGDARALTRSRALADYFESTAAALATDADFRHSVREGAAVHIEEQVAAQVVPKVKEQVAEYVKPQVAAQVAGQVAEQVTEQVVPQVAEHMEPQVAAQLAANWVRRDVLALLAERGAEIESAKLRPAGLAQLIALVQGGRTSARSGRALLAELLFAGGDPAALVSERGLEVVADPAALEALADEALRENPKAAASYAAGDGKALNFLMGQVMQKSRGKADPARAREIIQRKLEQR